MSKSADRIKEIKTLIREKSAMMNFEGANEEALNDQIQELTQELEMLEKKQDRV